ncbi:MAG: cytochrome-c oxidase, cbb3-type subunit III [Rhizobiales bacterium 35-66-30]|nr:MAG: cytochrome-c oxidase, cbb3-type subunit III [Rhizobiales bacterium 35-66-30]
MSTAHESHDAHVDAASGTATTGHEWDGIRELNNPLPRWWLWTFYACIFWAVCYWIAFPAWPLVSNYTTGGPELLALARAEGRVAFADNCAPCHGAGGGGAKGFPNLNDDDWLWGGTLAQIQETITHGIRAGDDLGHQGNMTPFGAVLSKAEISDAADFVRSLSGLVPAGTPSVEKGAAVFKANCAVCHGEDAKGNQELGSKNLTDGIWLYGSDKATIVQTITNGRGGVMPAWGERLSPTTLKALTVYVHTLGGGQ